MTFLNGRPSASEPLHATAVRVDPVSRLGWAGSQHALGTEVRLSDLLVDLDLDHPRMAAVRAFAVDTLGATPKDWRAAVKRERCRQRLGFVPERPREMPGAVADLLGLRVEPNGTMRGTGGDLAVDHLTLRVRTESVDLGLPFHRADLDDATLEWWQAEKAVARRAVVAAVLAPLPDPVEAAAVLAEFRVLVGRVMEGDADFATAVLLTFCWQVKRKLLGLPIVHHLMPVVSGRQGSGKSTFIHALVAALKAVAREVDLQELTEGRNIDLFRDNYIAFVDEMAKAGRACQSALKQVITAETLTLRPMRTNASVEVKQNLTLIGCCNEESLGDLLADKTGLRRFGAIRMRDRSDWRAVDAFDFARLWRSIDPEAPHPMLPHLEALQARQEADRDRSSTEVWQAHVAGDTGWRGLLAREPFRASAELFSDFALWEEKHFPKLGTNINAWGRAMTQEEKNGRGGFRRAKEGGVRGYLWKGGGA